MNPIDWVNVLAALTGGGAGIFAVLLKVWSERRFRSLKMGGLTLSLANEARPGDPLEGALERLNEVEAELARQLAVASTNRWMSRLLTVGQYIVGGLLASSFVQQSLSRELVGAMGLLVLLSSLIYQHFRPDIQLRGAMGRILRLRALIRQTTDDIYALRANPPGASTATAVADLRRKISSALSEIEASEFQDSTARSGEETTARSRRQAGRGPGG